jgi:kynurenine 3-monooxygenase
MIDLAENAGADFSLKKIWDVTLADATLHIEKQNEELGKIKNMMVLVLMVLLKNRHRMQRQSMFNYSQEF